MAEVDDGVRLRTWTTGVAGAGPPVVLLHGGPGLWDYLGPVAGLIDDLTVVHRFDQRGCGGSSPSADLTVARYVADLEFLRRHWGHQEWIVLGHSFGAELAFAYAVAHPGRTAALGWLNGVGVGDWRTGYRAEVRRRMTPAQADRLAELSSRDRGPDEEVEFRALSWFSDHASADRGWELALADARVDHAINFEANRRLTADSPFHTGADADVLADAGRLTMPCWFVHGEADPRPRSSVAALAAAVPHGRLYDIAAAGHQPWREQPEAFAGLLRDLIATTSRPTA